MNISTMLSTLKVIDEVMKLLNDIEVRTYIRTYSILQSVVCKTMMRTTLNYMQANYESYYINYITTLHCVPFLFLL